MAGYHFQDVTIAVFDIHTTLLPHLADAGDSYRAPFGFLADVTAYNQRYQAAQVVKTPHFEFGNLPRRSQHSHFWGPYAFDSYVQPPDYWALQIPLLGRLSNLEVGLNMSYPFLTHFGLKIWLSPLGWSTMLILCLQGKILKREIIEVMGKITGRTFTATSNADDHPFVIAGQGRGMTDIFKYCQDLLCDEIYTPGKQPHPAMKIPRHFVISLNKYTGDTVQYKQMPPADQGLMLSILYGRDIDAATVVGGGAPKVNCTEICGPNFALTDFNHGTLLFAQREAQTPEREGKGYCLSNNLRESLLMTLSQMYFYKLSKDIESTARVAELRERTKTNLGWIKSQYPNVFCQNLFRQHNDLLQICC